MVCLTGDHCGIKPRNVISPLDKQSSRLGSLNLCLYFSKPSVGILGCFPFSLNVQSVEMQTECADQTEISWNKRTTFGGSCSIPTSQNGNGRSICTIFPFSLWFFLSHHIVFFLYTNEIASLESIEKPFYLTRIVSGISNQNFSIHFCFGIINICPCYSD